MWINFKQKEASIIFDLFNGQLCSFLQCQRCADVSLTFEIFSCIQLSIPIEKLLLVTIRGFFFYLYYIL